MVHDDDPASGFAALLHEYRHAVANGQLIPTDGLKQAIDGFLTIQLAASDPHFWRHRWIDGLRIIKSSAESDFELKTAGLAVWAHTHDMFLAPFEFDARLAPDPPCITRYEIRFGVRDERTRLARVPYTTESIVRSRMFMHRPRQRCEWAFVLSM